MISNLFRRDNTPDIEYSFEETPNNDYETYSFPYKVYAHIKAGIDYRYWLNNVEKLYHKGFLMSRVNDRKFYLARSTRIDLEKFELSSENRRVLKKCDALNIRDIEAHEFKYSYEIGKMAIDFYKARFGDKTISAQAWKRIFTQLTFNDILQFTDGEKIVGYCPSLATTDGLHYAYPFYDLSYLDKNLGIAMILKTILHFKEYSPNTRYLYLGTCYTESALYKTQFKGFEWFNGTEWSTDITKLKEIVRT